MARTHLRKRILLPLLVLSLTTGVFLAVQLAEADQDRWDLSPEVQADLLARYPRRSPWSRSSGTSKWTASTRAPGRPSPTPPTTTSVPPIGSPN